MKFLILPFLFACALAAAPQDLLRGDPAKLMMPFLGLFLAGIFPTISLTINSLKSGGFSVKRVRDLASELRKLVGYLQVLFVISLVAALTLVVAETSVWGAKFPYGEYTGRVFNFVLGFCLGVLLSSLPRLQRTFGVLLTINREIAEDEAATKVKDRMSKVPSVIDRFPTKEKFGELFEAETLNKSE